MLSAGKDNISVFSGFNKILTFCVYNVDVSVCTCVNS